MVLHLYLINLLRKVAEESLDDFLLKVEALKAQVQERTRQLDAVHKDLRAAQLKVRTPIEEMR